jgi:hypothetical protein
MKTVDEEFKEIIARYVAAHNGRQVLLVAAQKALDLIDGYVDTVDGPEGQPMPNKAMRAQQILQAAIEKARKA